MNLVILVVDDEPDVEKLFRLHYASSSFEWLFARSGFIAIECLRERPDVSILLTDLAMPHMDGIELVETVRRDFPDVIPIVMSAHTEIGHVRRAMNAGAFDFVFKPFFFDDVDATIAKATAVLCLRAQEQQDHERLTMQNTLLRRAIDTVDTLGITISDAIGTIVYTNPADAKMHGYTVSEILGKPVQIFHDPSHHSTPPPAENDHWQRESRNRRKNDSTFPVFLISAQLRDEQGTFLGRVTIAEDVSRHRTSRQRATQLAQALQIVIRSKRHKTERFFLQEEQRDAGNPGAY